MASDVVLNIPFRDRKTLARLHQLSDKSFDSFLGALSTAPPTISTRDLAKTISSGSSVDEKDAYEIVRMTSGMYAAVVREERSGDFPLDEFLDVVAPATQDIIQAELDVKISREDTNRLRDRLHQILSLRNVFDVSAKAFDVLLQHQHVFERARVMTDIRPIFNVSDPNQLEGALVVHSLKLTYNLSDESHDIYVAMDGDDLEELISVLNRAKQKADTLSRHLDSSGLLNLNKRVE